MVRTFRFARLICRAFLTLLFVSFHISADSNVHADIIVVNANVRTMNARLPVAQAFAVAGNRITAVGTNKAIQKLAGPKTRVINARGRLVLPGFNDAHVHFMGIGNSFSSMDLRDVKSAKEIAERIGRYARFLPKNRWILGGGWHSELWKGHETPDIKLIDAVSPSNPVFLYSSDAKSAIASALALKQAGIKNTDSGTVVTGEKLKKTASAVPANHTRNWTEIAETATNYAASFGVTSVQDMHSDDSREVYRELQQQGKLKTRIYDCVPLPDWKKLTGRHAGEMVRGGCLKSFSDGDDESVSRLLKDVLPADRAGFQIMVHAIGGAATNLVLGVFEQAVKANGARDRRFRIEHAYDPQSDDLARFRKSNVIASMQPFLFDGGTGGRYRTLLALGARIAFGSDAAITDFDPLLGIHAAVNAGSESISVHDAVRAYTAGSAYAEFQERDKGTIETGKLADFVILSDDIFAININAIRRTTVLLTIVDGKVVFEAE